MDYSRPVRTLREAAVICRGLWAGEEVSYRGEIFSADRARLQSTPAAMPALVLGTRSRGVMRLAGELADRVLVGGALLVTGAGRRVPHVVGRRGGPGRSPSG